MSEHFQSLFHALVKVVYLSHTDILKDIKTCYKNCDISEAFIKVIEIACETSQISTTTSTSHTSSSSNDSNKVNNTQ